MERYEKKNMEETIMALRELIKVRVNDDGTLTLRAEAATPYFASKAQEDEARQLAKDMANFCIDELDKVNTRLKVKKASYTREFIEKRYLQNLSDLQKAEEKFKEFQEKYGTYALMEQTAATIEAAAALKVQIIAKEIEIGVLTNSYGDSHSLVVAAKNELHELTAKYKEFQYGAEQSMQINDSSRVVSQDLFLTFNDIPDIGIQYMRLFRDVTLQEKLLEFLLPQYEQAKIQEAKDTPTVQVLDKAVTPIKRIKPQRKFFVLAWGGLSLILSLLLVFSVEYWQKSKAEGTKDFVAINAILKELSKDFRKIKNFFSFRKLR
jgi:capsule polysaccharide export protein KpsE/RkpR